MGHRGSEKIEYFKENSKGATNNQNLISQEFNLSNEPN